MAAFNSHNPWYVNCEAVRSRNCSATSAGTTKSLTQKNMHILKFYICHMENGTLEQKLHTVEKLYNNLCAVNQCHKI